MEHFHLPWRVSGTGHICSGDKVVPFDDLKENAAFIVRACNSHYALVEALESALEYLAPSKGFSDLDRAVFVIRAALAKAKGE